MNKGRSVCLTSVFVTALGLAATSVAQSAEQTKLAEIVNAETSAFVNDVSARRRTNSLFVNRQSPAAGVQENHVNTSRGNLTFLMRDLVRRAGMPIVFGRVYDSSHANDGDFGPGWKLSVREEIALADGGYVFTDAANGEYRFAAIGNDLAPLRAGLTTIRSGTLHPATSARVAGATLRSGNLIRHFDLVGDRYRLVGVVHRDGELSIGYSGERIVSIKSGNARVVIVRRADGRIVAARDDIGRAVSYGYDEGGRLATITDLADGVWRMAYDGASGRLVSLHDPRRAKVLDATYADGKVAMMRALSTRATFRYSRGSTKSVDGRSRTTTFLHENGLTVGIVAPSGMFAQVAFDDDQRPVSVIRDGAGETRMAYDAEGRLTAVTDAGGTAKFRYGAHGLEDVVGPRSVRYRYDGHGRVTEVSDRHGSRRYGWTDGTLSAVALDGMATELTTDDLGAVTDVRRDGVSLLAYAYDIGGRVTGTTYGDGTVAAYSYGARGLRTQATYTLGRVTASAALGYDAGGNLTGYALELPDGRTVTQAYEVDAFNQVKRVTNGGGLPNPTVSFSYDGAGRLTGAQAGNRLTAVSYDDVDRIVRVELNGDTLLSHDYGALDTDAVAERDWRSGEVAVPQGASGVFGTMDSIVHARPAAADYGIVAYDTGLKTLVLREDALAPDAALLSGLERRMVPLQAHGVDSRMFGHDKPSSGLFIPPEFRSVNCAVCLCLGTWG